MGRPTSAVEYPDRRNGRYSPDRHRRRRSRSPSYDRYSPEPRRGRNRSRSPSYGRYSPEHQRRGRSRSRSPSYGRYSPEKRRLQSSVKRRSPSRSRSPPYRKPMIRRENINFRRDRGSYGRVVPEDESDEELRGLSFEEYRRLKRQKLRRSVRNSFWNNTPSPPRSQIEAAVSDDEEAEDDKVRSKSRSGSESGSDSGSEDRKKKKSSKVSVSVKKSDTDTESGSDDSDSDLDSDSDRSKRRSRRSKKRSKSSRRGKKKRSRKSDDSEDESDEEEEEKSVEEDYSSDDDRKKRKSKSKSRRSSSSSGKKKKRSSRKKRKRRSSDSDTEEDSESESEGEKRSSKKSRSKKKRKRVRESSDEEDVSGSGSGRGKSESEIDEKALKIVEESNVEEEDDGEVLKFKEIMEQRKAAALMDEDDAPVGPQPLPKADGHISYGGALRPGEGDAIAQFVQQGKRIPRRGEVGLSADEISKFEDLGYVMSGSRHQRMNAIRIRKENQVYSAEDKRALAMYNSEEKAKRESRVMSDLKRLVQRTIGEEVDPNHDPFGAKDDGDDIARGWAIAESTDFAA